MLALLLCGLLFPIANSWPPASETTLRVGMSDANVMHFGTTVSITVLQKTSNFTEFCILFSSGGRNWIDNARPLQLYFAKNNISASNFKPPRTDSGQTILVGSGGAYTKSETLTVMVVITETAFAIFMDHVLLHQYLWDSKDAIWGKVEDIVILVNGEINTANGYITSSYPKSATVPIDLNWNNNFGRVVEQDVILMFTGWPDPNNNRLCFDFLPPLDFRYTYEATKNKTLMTFVIDFTHDQVAVNGMDDNLQWLEEKFVQPTYLKKEHYFVVYFLNTIDAVEIVIVPQPGFRILYRLIHRKRSEEVYGRFRWGDVYVGDFKTVPYKQFKFWFESSRSVGSVVTLGESSYSQGSVNSETYTGLNPIKDQSVVIVNFKGDLSRYITDSPTEPTAISIHSNNMKAENFYVKMYLELTAVYVSSYREGEVKEIRTKMYPADGSILDVFYKLDKAIIHIVVDRGVFHIFLNRYYLGNTKWQKIGDEKLATLDYVVISGKEISASVYVPKLVALTSPTHGRDLIGQIDPRSTQWETNKDKIFEISGYFSKDFINDNINSLEFNFVQSHRHAESPQNSLRALLQIKFDFVASKIIVNDQNKTMKFEKSREQYDVPCYLRENQYFRLRFKNGKNNMELIVFPDLTSYAIYLIPHRKASNEKYGRFHIEPIIYIADAKFDEITVAQHEAELEKLELSRRHIFARINKKSDVEYIEELDDQLGQYLNESII